MEAQSGGVSTLQGPHVLVCTYMCTGACNNREIFLSIVPPPRHLNLFVLGRVHVWSLT